MNEKAMKINFCPNCGAHVKQNANFCSSCGYKIAELRETDHKEVQRPSREIERPIFQSKREKILGEEKTSSSSKLAKFTVIGVLTAFAIFMFIKSLPSRSNPIIENQPIVTSEIDYTGVNLEMYDIDAEIRDGKIIIPLDVVLDKKLVGFQYKKGYRKVPLLAYISPEGRIVTAISICEPCNSERFHTEGDHIVCNACGTRWELESLFGISGACQKYPPDPIPSIIVGNEIHIDEKIVTEWKRRI
jgi:uncharacterized membrane protein